jgi:hypothetical protein
MPKCRKQPWEQWLVVTKPMYLRHMKGWPSAEMRGYWAQGKSPLEACDVAIARRLKLSSTEPKVK